MITIESASLTLALTRDLVGQVHLTVVSVELIPYIRKGNSSDEFLICQPEFRCCRQPWTRKASEGMEVDVVKCSGKRPDQYNADGSGENVLGRDSQRDKLRHGNRLHGNAEL